MGKQDIASKQTKMLKFSTHILHSSAATTLDAISVRHCTFCVYRLCCCAVLPPPSSSSSCLYVDFRIFYLFMYYLHVIVASLFWFHIHCKQSTQHRERETLTNSREWSTNGMVLKSKFYKAIEMFERIWRSLIGGD